MPPKRTFPLLRHRLLHHPPRLENSPIALACADYDKTIALDPKHASAYENRGRAYKAKGDLDRAIADYDKAIALDPKDASAYNLRGLAYKSKGDLDRAIADYDKAIVL